MSTSPVARISAGVPTGGQFAATTHAEPALSLTPAQRYPQLEGWPESLAEPQIDITMNDEGGLTTSFDLGDGRSMEVWTDNSSTGRCDAAVYGDWDDSDVDAAMEWTERKHRDLERQVREETKTALALTKARIVGPATGTRDAIFEEDLQPFTTAASPETARPEGHPQTHAEASARLDGGPEFVPDLMVVTPETQAVLDAVRRQRPPRSSLAGPYVTRCWHAPRARSSTRRTSTSRSTASASRRSSMRCRGKGG